jgi:hypothetical protein
MKLIYLIPVVACSLFLILTSRSWGQTVPDEMDLFLLIGQSNMAGRGAIESQDQLTNPHIFMLTKDLKWVLAKDPVHFDKPSMSGVGLCSQFARTLIKEDPKLNIGLIPCAMGGSKLDEWKPGSKLYDDAVSRTREAMKKGRLAGILWHQGESDSSHAHVEVYAPHFADMIKQLRNDLNATQIPLIVGELGRYKKEYNEFNAALPKIVASVPLCTMVTSEDLKDKGDHTHFDSASLRTYGERYAKEYLKVRSTQSSTVAK